MKKTKFEGEHDAVPNQGEKWPEGFVKVEVIFTEAEWARLADYQSLTVDGTPSNVIRGLLLQKAPSKGQMGWMDRSGMKTHQPRPQGLLKAFAKQREHLHACDVCEKRRAIGVAAMPGVPVSFAYCGVCLMAGAHPYWAIVGNTASAALDQDMQGEVNFDEMADWWKRLCLDTLKHLDKNFEEFMKDVNDTLAGMREEEVARAAAEVTVESNEEEKDA